jgi:murein L,D-transpeptidase YafK
MSWRTAVYTIALLAAGVVAAAAADFIKLARHVPSPAPETERADRILIEKSQRRLVLFRNDRILREYSIALGASPLGDKEREGDGRTPEGLYAIDFKNAQSAFHLSLHISYPDAGHLDAARRQGLSPGGDIMIHGLPNGLALLGPLHRMLDWTDGCIAVTNREIEEIWAMTDVGTPIEIRE